MSDSGLEIFILAGSVVSLGAGLYGLSRPQQLADRNREHVESGEERFFEERRTWKHYGGPITDPHKVRRTSYIEIATGVVGLVIFWLISVQS